MHYRVFLRVELETGQDAERGPDGAAYESIAQSLGVQAMSAQEALAYAENHATRETRRGRVHYAEVGFVPAGEVPPEVLSSATVNPERPGVYWTSGRVFAREEEN
jgi:hypothetical protein